MLKTIKKNIPLGKWDVLIVKKYNFYLITNCFTKFTSFPLALSR
jgi:hypothetical protein